MVLMDSGNYPSGFHLRGFHPLRRSVPRDFGLAFRTLTGPHHISPSLLKGIQFALCRVPSTVITASQLLSFPAGTKILQFPASPFLSEQLRNPWLNGCMRLAKAFRSLPRPSSTLKPSYPLAGLRNSLHDRLASAPQLSRSVDTRVLPPSLTLRR